MMFINASSRIFVSIAAYRDTETPKTVANLLAQADRPEQVRVGVLSQIDQEVDQDCIVGPYPNVSECFVDPQHSKGACWARSFIWTNLLRDEDFCLQIDSHSRFDKGWDTKLLAMFEKTNDPMAVIAHYPSAFDSVEDKLPDVQQYTRFNTQQFNNWGFPLISSAALSLKDAPAMMEPTCFIAGGSTFTRTKTIRTVPYDPFLYFQGEEINYAIRLYTHGYNLYLPNVPFMYHDYGNKRKRPLHWQDAHQTDWKVYNQRAIARNRHVLGIEASTCPLTLENIELYGLGKVRTVAQWEAFSGIDLKNKTLADKAKTGVLL